MTAIEYEILGSSDGKPHQTYKLTGTFIPSVDIWVNELGLLPKEEIKNLVRNGKQEAQEVHDKHGNTLEFWVKWYVTHDLSESSGHERCYEIDLASGTVRFGDGQHGAIPPSGVDNIKASYRTGSGTTGYIPKEVALKLCEQIREKNRRRWYSFYGIWCWFCHRFAKGNPDKLCFSNRPDNRGCHQVNKRYDKVKAR
jgi:hypothetical protein